MKYPSLLFTNDSRRGDIDPSVCNDLRLDLMLPASTLEVMSGICPRSDIPLRSEVFSAMDEPSLNKRILDLGKIINAASSLDAASSEVSDKKLKDVLFVRTAERICAFCMKAAEITSDCYFIKRIADFFKSVCSDASFESLKKDANSLCEKLSVLSKFTVTVQDELYGGEKSEKSDICSRLKAAADELEIELDLPVPLEYRASDEFAVSLISDSEELCRKASDFCDKYKRLIDLSILGYAEELDFYLSIHSLLCRINEAGIPLCRPRITDKDEISFRSAYDFTLLEKDEKNIVPNDVYLGGKEKFFFLGGANGGGKTTFLRTLGINVLLAISGAPAAAHSAELGQIDGVFTHFPHDEHFEGEGRFDNEKRRVSKIVASMGRHPLILLNETYSTTNEEKSVVSTSELAELLCKRGVYGIYVTHAHEAQADGVGRLVVTVDENDGNRRTYKVARAFEENRSFAEDILKKYGLTYQQLDAVFSGEEAVK
ncbi:MAG: hypothetical protein IJC50_04325 [Clostridia bacterium]|nr:hypothetical protein [Clostridia bacterium]